MSLIYKMAFVNSASPNKLSWDYQRKPSALLANLFNKLRSIDHIRFQIHSTKQLNWNKCQMGNVKSSEIGKNFLKLHEEKKYIPALTREDVTVSHYRAGLTLT